MSLFKRALSTCIAAVLFAAQPATSTPTVTVGNYGGTYGTYGYSEPHTGAPQGWGSISGATLPDGKVISGFFEQADWYTYSPYQTSWITISIKGFTSDPGQSYFNNTYATCLPTVLYSSAANYYSYSSWTGAATWYFYGIFTYFPDFPNYYDSILADHSTCDLYVN